MLTHILAQMNASLQPDDSPFTLDDAKQHQSDYNAWVDSQEPCEHIAPLGGDFICADCFARSKGFDNAHHLSGIADLIQSVLKMKQLETSIESHQKRIALLSSERAMMEVQS